MNKTSQQAGETIALPDGRNLGYLISGEGKPVFYFHGLPGSRLEILLTRKMSNIKVIGVDRPGFGLSTFEPNRRISDFTADVSFLADYLGIDKFALLGVSGGAHYVITCAAMLKQRVTRAVAASGLSLPLDTSDMSFTNKSFAKVGTMPIIGTLVHKQYRKMVLRGANDPDGFIRSKQGQKMLKTVPAEQKKLYFDPVFQDYLSRSLPEAYLQGSDAIKAVIQEWKLIKKGWDVDLSKIPSGVVYLWHGSEDKGVPVSNAYRNAKDIPGAHIEIFEGRGHGWFFFDHLDKLADLLNSTS